MKNKIIQQENQENIEQVKQKIVQKISNIFPKGNILNDVARYSLLNIGKCLRGYLSFCFAKLIGLSEHQAILSGTIVELIHTFSLIHDDLPAIDNSNIRRGKPSCHIAFNEATAILIGTEILTRANLIASENFRTNVSIEIHKTISQLIEGQMEDLQILSKEKKVKLENLETMYINKCGSMFALCSTIPAIQKQLTKKQIYSLKNYGNALGIAFQLQDDIEDNNIISISNIIGNSKKIEEYIKNKMDITISLMKQNFTNRICEFFTDYTNIALNHI